eukprot:SAG22_NODE_1098_length_5567_cov_27.664045_2_plen_167_part_00
MYYGFMQLGPTAGMSNRSKAQITWGNRAFGNLHEQSTIFLVSLWLHALFVSVDGAAALGWAYLLFRSLYPVLWAVCGPMPQSMAILWSTMPQYGINWWMMSTTVASTCFGLDLKAATVDYLGVPAGYADAAGSFIFVFVFFVRARSRPPPPACLPVLLPRRVTTNL